MAALLHGSESSDITRPGQGWRSAGLRDRFSNYMMNCAANLVVEDPTLSSRSCTRWQSRGGAAVQGKHRSMYVSRAGGLNFGVTPTIRSG